MTFHSQHHRRRRLAGVVATATLTVAGFGAATATSSATAAPATETAPSATYVDGRYLVTFVDEPAATYEGEVAGYPRTRPDAGKKLNPTRGEVVKYRDRLAKIHDVALRTVGATKLYDYSVATNGVASELTATQARRLAKTTGVLRLERDAMQTLETTESPAFLGLSDPGGLWSQSTGGAASAGKGVIVGIIDSGIWPESASFAGAELKRDKAGQPVAATGLRGRWFGACVQGELFSSLDCNDKLIGARYYAKGFGLKNLAQEEYVSPRDGGGHGTHTASTAAGNQVPNATIDGVNQGTASGMAPGADVAAYKVCWEAKPGASGGCFNSDSIAAIDDAVADGVDVLNYSVGGSSESSPLDSVEQAYRRASNIGIFVANSAGNSGPGASTLDHPSPWLTTVAASTFRSSQKAVRLGNGAEYIGASVTATLPATPLVRSETAKLAGAAVAEAKWCFPGTLDPAKTAGKIVQCDRGVISRVDKSFEVKRAGGVGMVLTNTAPNSLNSDFHAVPTVHVSEVARAAIIAYIESAISAPPTAAIVTSAVSVPVPDVAAFSSRGPSTTTAGDILKPDLSAPGVDVLAAVAPPSNHGRSFDYYSGTSMSSPHIAGIGALIKAAHPGWSPMAVKSALMTSAVDHASSADPFAQGAGFVQPNKAVDPGLVFEAGATDWRRYMVGLGVQFRAPFDTLTALTGSDLNQASVAIGSMAGRRTLSRTVTNVSAEAETYSVAPALAGVAVTGDTEPFSLAPGASKTLSLTFTRTSAPLGSWAKGTITFVGSTHRVRIPVAIRPVAIAAPAELSGSIADGSTTFSVTPGFDGSMMTSVTGLVGATPQAGSVATGEYVATVVSAATKSYTLEVPAGVTLARFDVDATSDLDDLDLYVYRRDSAGALQIVDVSASAAGDEQVTLRAPEPGTYVAFVNGYDTGQGGAYTHTAWALESANSGNLTVTPSPATATLATPLSLTATWSGLTAGQRYLGWLGYTGPDGLAADITVVSVG